MKRLVGLHVWPLLFAVLALALVASADTLELKDRRVINGKFMGGTQTQVRFEVDGKVELFPVRDIVALTFGSEADAAPAATGKTRSSTTHPSSAHRVTVPAGTNLLVRMIDSVDSDKNKVGDRFRASLEQDLAVDNTVVAPKGTELYGRLAEAKEAGHIAGKSELKLELTDIVINQQTQPIITGDYDVAGKSRGSQSAKRIGGGAALGAVIGAIAGGGKGAAIGAGVGAGAGTAVQVFTRGEQVRVPSETLLEFRLQQALTVEPAHAPAR